ncbi:response regulator [bacterium]|nr:MAG: response regulator [bacterium]
MNGQMVDILLVEDNPKDEELTLRALRKNNVANEVQVARDGAEALELLFGDASPGGGAAFFPKLILLDLKLPKVGGLEVLKRIRGDARLGNVPVVVLTSSREESDLAESYHLGVNSYVVKPVDFSKFTDAVRQLGLYWLLLNQAPPPRKADG